MSFLNAFKQSRNKETQKNLLKSTPEILGGNYIHKIIPHKGWHINEDYVDILDNGTVIAPVLIYADYDKASNLPAEWGITFIRDLVNDAIGDTHKANLLNVSFINNVRILSKDWTKKHQENADRYSDKNTNGHREKAKVKVEQEDLSTIAQELRNGSSYLAVGMKYVVAAKDRHTLDTFLISLQRRIELDVPGIIIALPNGDVDLEFGHLFNNPMDEPGRKLMFTSAEYAGFYNIVTHGIEDSTGVYVGEQQNDINNTAVIWDMTRFDRHAVIATSNRFARKIDYDRGQVENQFLDYTGSDLWLNTLIMQLVREKQGRVFTLALDPIHLNDRLDTVTASIDLNHGRINPFEMFGRKGREREIYSANQAKWEAMTRQMAEQTITTKNAVQTEPISPTELSDLDTVLSTFYHDYHMWPKDPDHEPQKIRILNLPHRDVPRLTQFIAYLDTEYHKYSRPQLGDPIKANEINKLLSIYRRLDSANGDLFDTWTDPIFGSLGQKRHTLFDYSHLSERKGNILLIQLLNSISAIANQMRDGDVIIIHGAQRIVNLTQSYIQQILDDLYARHVRVVFSYNTPEAMLKSANFNQMSSADWVLTGNMTADQVAKYNELLGNQRRMTDVIVSSIQTHNEARYYLRRGQDNIIFDANQLM